MDDFSLRAARLLADGINPSLAVLLAASAVMQNRKQTGGSGGGDSRLRALRWDCFAVGCAVGLAEAGKWAQVWPEHLRFPSGHEAFAAACAVCLVMRDRRWAGVALPLAGALGWSLLRAGYHDGVEAVGGACVGAGIAGGVAGILKARSARQTKESRGDSTTPRR